MLTHDTLRKLNEMKLFGMAQGFEDQLASAAAAHLSFEERFGLLTDQEMTFRENRRLWRLLRNAKLRESACIEDVDYRTGRGLERSEIASLALCNWIRHGINLIVSGASGSGKTWMGCAFGNQACRQGLTVLFQRLPLLLEEAVSHGDGHCPAPEKLFTWWSYRSPDCTVNNRARRLDHVWASADLAPASRDYTIHTPCRSWDKPSDHVPVVVKLRV